MNNIDENNRKIRALGKFGTHRSIKKIKSLVKENNDIRKRANELFSSIKSMEDAISDSPEIQEGSRELESESSQEHKKDSS